jgi:hypothetical protein
MWIWLAVIVVFFSLPRSKLVGYVLPALPPLAYLIAQRVLAGRVAEALLPKVRAHRAGIRRRVRGLRGGVAMYAVPPGTRLRLPAGQAGGAGDQVLMLDSYFYEIPFYWNLRQPVLVSDDWKAAARDTARQLAQGNRGRRPLRAGARRGHAAGPHATRRHALRAAVTWIVGTEQRAARATPGWPARNWWLSTKSVAAWRFAGSASAIRTA